MLRSAHSTGSRIGWLPELFLFFCILFISQAGFSLQVPAPPIIGHSVDLQVSRIEVTQAIQAYDNSVPLIAGKSTYVRAFVSEGHFVGNTIPGVLGEMYVRRPPTGNWVGPIPSIDGRIDVHAFPDQGNVDDGFLFAIPSDLTQQQPNMPGGHISNRADPENRDCRRSVLHGIDLERGSLF